MKNIILTSKDLDKIACSIAKKLDQDLKNEKNIPVAVETEFQQKQGNNKADKISNGSGEPAENTGKAFKSFARKIHLIVVYLNLHITVYGFRNC